MSCQTHKQTSFPGLEVAVENGFEVEADSGDVYVVRKPVSGGRWLRAVVPHAERRAEARTSFAMPAPLGGRVLARRIA
jgi:hypothetical protein